MRFFTAASGGDDRIMIMWWNPAKETRCKIFCSIFFPEFLRESDSYELELELESVNTALAGDTGGRLWMDEHIVVIFRFEIVW